MEDCTSAYEDHDLEDCTSGCEDHDMKDCSFTGYPIEGCSVDIKERSALSFKFNTPKITDLPPEIVQLILRKLSFENIAKLRFVSRYFNNMCSSILNSEFNHLRALLLQRFNGVKALMPRRESARRKHPLSRESDILETLYMRLSLLHMTFGKYIENKSCCFFPGEIIDESYRILRYIDSTPNLNRAYKVTDELFDLSTMALEYFKENIEPRLPEISFLTYDMLHNPPLITTGIDLVIQKAKSKLMHMEITDTSIANETPQLNNSLLAQFIKDLKKTQRLAKKNKNDIAKIKRSLKVAKAKVKTAIREVQQVKWQQSSCKKLLLNDLYNMEVQKHESSSDTAIYNPSSNDIKIS